MKFVGVGFSVATVVWMGLIFYLSSLPGVMPDDVNAHPIEAVVGYGRGGFRSYVGHIVLYGVLAALIQAVLWGWNLGLRVRWMIIAAITASLFGVTDEYHQSFVVGRDASGLDLLVDTAAATMSAILLWAVAIGRLRAGCLVFNQTASSI